MRKHDIKLTMEFCSDAVCLNSVGSYPEKIYKHLLERRHKLEQDDSEASAIVQTHAGDARAKDKNGQRRGGTKGAGTRDVAPAAGVALVTVPPKVPGRGAPRPAPPAAGPAEPAGLAAARAPAQWRGPAGHGAARRFPRGPTRKSRGSRQAWRRPAQELVEEQEPARAPRAGMGSRPRRWPGRTR